ncbi:nickel pincer cofactor biosynthesis protein LarB [Lusitaniella coriacea LEGE 07157]|uniref:Nickel pincer cofactor biosynthesis protein LarB n=1 Tax=Lusitaniella coriacea LEGE 07157 TaxID=945747 RepID=A0A8J7DYF9_9CYAN|nr:nickel pincer cofactor biosynthesis protein LarB [Lusitaniella coriacea]MBE9117847.1 nickel pincer cofactor biosynthesis protein LarB [Lusitaniella coriacea LEGE 07157]
MTQPEALKVLLEAISTGEVSPAVALDKLKHFGFEPVGDFAKIDNHRSLRTGFPEVVWGQDKTPQQIIQIIKTMRANHPVVMATRIEREVYQELRESIPDLQYYPVAKICAISSPETLPNRIGKITILTAGTADIPVAEEAAVTAELCGFQAQRLWDVGVAGIHRLLSNRHVIDEADVLIVVAGMEGALPSVVAGMADCPVIAVPTSVGYGANFSGVSPLLTMLNSCAAGIGVVNINNGFGAAILAGQILRAVQKVNPDVPVPAAIPESKDKWTLAYGVSAEGRGIEGKLETLMTAVRRGAEVRLAIDFPGSHEYITEAQHLWIKKGVAFAQASTQVNVEFNKTGLMFPKKILSWTILASTQGDLEIARWRPGKHKFKGRTSHKVAIRWFVR